MGRLDGKVALISGTAGGMGRAAAQVFADEGAIVFGCDIDPDGQAETERLVTAAGGVMAALVGVDISSAEGAGAWIDAALERHDRIDVLYNNASRLRLGAFGEQTFEDWAFTIDNSSTYRSTALARPGPISSPEAEVLSSTSRQWRRSAAPRSRR
jgi:meso-butanediol dehydrogenase/(S,S)-butanediol dehydrogenase/diacetyl reductase